MQNLLGQEREVVTIMMRLFDEEQIMKSFNLEAKGMTQTGKQQKD